MQQKQIRIVSFFFFFSDKWKAKKKLIRCFCEMKTKHHNLTSWECVLGLIPQSLLSSFINNTPQEMLDSSKCKSFVYRGTADAAEKLIHIHISTHCAENG